MRILHVSPHLPPDQAANAILPALAGAWSVARGHRVGFVAHPPAQGGLTSAELAGPVAWIPRRDADPSMSRLLRIDAWRRMRHIHAVLDGLERPDLLHLHSNGLLVEGAAGWAVRREVPYVLTLYGTEIWHYRPRWPIDLFTRAYRGAAAVTFYSNGLMRYARDAGLDREGLSTVYPAVPQTFEAFDRHTRRAWREGLGIQETHLIVNVKRLHELAGQAYLLEAFARLRAEGRNVRLVICGTGALREALEAQAASLDIADAVTFTGLVGNDQVARYVGAADVFALPSLLEALPTVAVEALASGTPVVSADHPGGVELHGIFGEDVVIVPRRDPAALASALGATLDSGRRTSPATAETLMRLFRPDAIAARYDALYAQVVRPGQAR